MEENTRFGRRKRDKEITKQRKQKIIAISALSFVIVILILTVLLKQITPSKKVMELTEYYQVADDEVMLVLQNSISEKRGLYVDGVIYIDYETVKTCLNKRFYWDASENILIYTTPTEIIRTEVGSKQYYVNKSKSSVDYQIVKTKGEDVYIALDYVKLYSNVEYKFYEKPNRVVLDYKWGETLSYKNVKKATQIRYDANIKSDILKTVKEGDYLFCLETDTEIKKGFEKVITEDGVVGYVKSKYLSEMQEKKLENNYKETTYSHISKDYTVNLVWHQVTNAQANENVLAALEGTKGVTCISPTWFEVVGNDGSISSLASEKYVERVHNYGAEVWGLCSDFNKEISMLKILSKTTSRDKLINELLANAIKFNLDGINIDFERITEECGPHYIQFLRELSVKCRNNGIVLSVDSYVPSSYTKYYDRQEQGEILDYVVIMAYDEHYGGSEEAGSVSSIEFVQKAIQDTLEEVPSERVIVGLPFYTRIWKEVRADGNISVTSNAYGMQQAYDTMTQSGAIPKWDKTIGQYYAEYKTGEALYRCWLEDEKSYELKLKAATEGKVAGVAAWKLGLEKSTVWNVIHKYVN